MANSVDPDEMLYFALFAQACLSKYISGKYCSICFVTLCFITALLQWSNGWSASTLFIIPTQSLDVNMWFTLLLMNMTCPVLANSVDTDQLASEEANSEANWSGSALFVI